MPEALEHRRGPVQGGAGAGLRLLPVLEAVVGNLDLAPALLRVLLAWQAAALGKGGPLRLLVPVEGGHDLVHLPQQSHALGQVGAATAVALKDVDGGYLGDLRLRPVQRVGWRLRIGWQAESHPAGESVDQRRRLGGHGQRRRCLARLAGIEPTTLGFGGQYSIH